MRYEIETIEDLIDAATAENVELLKKDIGAFLDYAVSIKQLAPLGVTTKPRFVWNDDGIEGVSKVTVEVKR